MPWVSAISKQRRWQKNCWQTAVSAVGMPVTHDSRYRFRCVELQQRCEDRPGDVHKAPINFDLPSPSETTLDSKCLSICLRSKLVLGQRLFQNPGNLGLFTTLSLRCRHGRQVMAGDLLRGHCCLALSLDYRVYVEYISAKIASSPRVRRHRWVALTYKFCRLRDSLCTRRDGRNFAKDLTAKTAKHLTARTLGDNHYQSIYGRLYLRTLPSITTSLPTSI